MKIKDRNIVLLFFFCILLMEFLLFRFCFVSFNYAPPLVRVIIILLVIFNSFCLLYFTYRSLKWLIKKIHKGS